MMDWGLASFFFLICVLPFIFVAGLVYLHKSSAAPGER